MEEDRRKEGKKTESRRGVTQEGGRDEEARGGTQRREGRGGEEETGFLQQPRPTANIWVKTSISGQNTRDQAVRTFLIVNQLWAPQPETLFVCY